MANGDGGWHLDKRVPISIIAAILCQTFAIGWYISALETRVRAIEATQVQRVDERDRLITMEEKIKAVLDAVSRLERQLERSFPPPAR